MTGNIRVGSLFGIPFYVNPSWFLVLALVTFSYGNNLALQFPGLPTGVPLLLGLVTALLLFASVLAHELGHSFVALRQGIEVQSITLFLFGGLASLERESKSPAEAFWVAIAGPIVSLLLFGGFTLIGLTTPITGAFATILAVLSYVNLALALFNLIPGLPLDGGNVLKAIVWQVTGNAYKGVQVAGRVGQFIGWGAIASCLLPLLLFGSFANIWNGLIGWFLLQNASRAVQFARVQEQLADLTALDAVTAGSPVVSEQLSLREFADMQILSRNDWHKFLVTNQDGQLVGTIATNDLQNVPVEDWADTPVRNLMHEIEPSLTVSSDRPLLDVVKLLEEKRLPALPVIQENGVLVGLLEKTAIVRLLQHRVQATPA